MDSIKINKLLKCSDTDGDHRCFMCKDDINLCPNRNELGEFIAKILLTTEDGVDISQGDHVWWLRKPNATVANKDLVPWQYGQTKDMQTPDPVVFLYFADFSNLRSYIINERHDITLDNICELYQTDRQSIVNILNNKIHG